MPDRAINHWSEVDGGFRSSYLLRLGAIIIALGAALNFTAYWLGSDGDPLESLNNVAWILFILALWALAGGFFWVATYPFLTRFGFVVGAMHAAHSVLLMVLFFTYTPAPFPPVSLTVGRLLATILFAFLEREWLSLSTRRWLIAAAGLQLLKVVARALGYWPEFGPVLDAAVNAGMLVFLAAAFLKLGNAINSEENIWAKKTYESSHADFADFNNPEHSWNKGESGGR